MREGVRYLVWMAGESRDGIRGSDWHLATAMARHARILWVDPPVSPATPRSRRNGARRSLWPLLSSVNDQIVRLTPIALPGLSRPGVRATTAALVRNQVNWALRQLDIRPFAVISTQLEDLLGHWGRDVVNVLYGTDDYVAGADLMGLSARRLRRQELRALARADVVAAVSPQLALRWTNLGANPVLIPNGCWPLDGGVHAVPPAMQDLPRPVVGLVGQLSERIDLGVLEAIVVAGFSLVMVGPLDPRLEQYRFKKLIGKSSVLYTGPVAADAVPSYLAAIDIGITPYRDTPFNRASFPLKTLEYLGAGLPVVSADLPSARWLHADLTRGENAGDADQILAIACGNVEFLNAIRRIAASADDSTRVGSTQRHGRSEVRADRCIAFAARHSWSRRAEEFAAAISLV